MTASVPSDTKGRHRLDRRQIVDAALALADAEGIAAVTIRRVAGALSAGTMSLYRHVASKEALLDALADRIAGDIPLPAASTDWRQGLRARAQATRRICLAHPWAARLLESRLASGPARLDMQEAGLALLCGGGFPIGLACQALTVLDSYIYGFTLRETALPLAEDLPDIARDLQPAIRPEAYPHLVAAMTQALGQAAEGGAARLMEAEFLFGLDLLLTGLDDHAQRSQ